MLVAEDVIDGVWRFRGRRAKPLEHIQMRLQPYTQHTNHSKNSLDLPNKHCKMLLDLHF